MKTITVLFLMIVTLAKTHTQNYKINFAGTGDTTGVLCKDNDGNNYTTVKIGTQVWMAENLKTTKYRNGDPIPNVTDGPTWWHLRTGAYCNYNNNVNNSTTNGSLYNWYAVNDSRNIAPAGWHVPTDAEWTTLTTYLGGASIAGGKLKEADITHFLSPNTGATNETGFTALPGGYRDNTGTFSGIRADGFWWSFSENSPYGAWARSMNSTSPGVGRLYTNEGTGFSVRCVMDAIPTSIVNTTAASSITITSASSGGNVISDGGAAVTARGICWSTNQNPTIADNKTTDGGGIGSFNSNLTALIANTLYYVRAYATNSQGTAYGNQVTFTTGQITTQPSVKRTIITDTIRSVTDLMLPKNPSGFTATRSASGDVILRWNPVVNAINYNLQGTGVQPGLSRPGAGVQRVSVTGTTYTVKGLLAGTHSWVLLAVYSGPSGPYFGDESNPARTTLTIAANPSGFTAMRSASGDVILSWNSVPNAMKYNLQGAGVQPVSVTGKTYTVRGLLAGTHSWVLFAVYNGPTGPYFGDELNPARTNLTIAVAPSSSARWTGFDPATHGFRFVNSFHNNFIGPPISKETRGLCGGMSYTVLDYYNAGRPIPNQAYRPANNTPIQKYLYDRQVTSLASNIDKWVEISVNPFGLRTDEFFNWGINERLRELRSYIDQGVPIVLGLKGSEGTLHDHQVLAIGYDAGRYQGDLGNYKDDLKIYIFDPNHPTETQTLVPNPGTKEYYYLEHTDESWRTYFVDNRYAFVNPPNIVNPSYPADGLVHELLFEFSTGPDDMRGGADHVDVTVKLTNNSSQYYPNVSQNGRWLPDYIETAQVVLSQPLAQAMIRTIEISTNAASDLTADNWDLLSMKVKAVGGGFTRDLLIRPAGPWRFTGARMPLVIDVR